MEKVEGVGIFLKDLSYSLPPPLWFFPSSSSSSQGAAKHTRARIFPPCVPIPFFLFSPPHFLEFFFGSRAEGTEGEGGLRVKEG